MSSLRPNSLHYRLVLLNLARNGSGYCLLQAEYPKVGSRYDGTASVEL